MGALGKLLNSKKTWMVVMLTAVVMLAFAPMAMAQATDPSQADQAATAAAEASPTFGDIAANPLWFIAPIGAIVALIFAWIFYKQVKNANPGDAKMIEIAGHVTEGAMAYLKRQYKVVSVFFVVVAIVLYIMGQMGIQHQIVCIAFLSGGFFSGLCGWFGMKTATLASNRTTQGAKEGLNRGLTVAFRAGAVMGLVVVGFGLIDICGWFVGLTMFSDMSLTEITVVMLTFGMGASSQALFARVGGGIYTKAADVGADLVGKVEAGIPEDDPRNPATIADNVGDNVGDVAGMGADLYESYCGSILATAALGVAAVVSMKLGNKEAEMEAAMRLLSAPMILAGIGIFLSLVGIFMVRTKDGATMKQLMGALMRGVMGSSLLILVAAYFICQTLLGGIEGVWATGIFIAICIGMVAGLLIGKATEVYTSYDYAPTREVSKNGETGPATVIISGIAEGMKSTWMSLATVIVAIIGAYCFAGGTGNPLLGLYGVGIAAVSMLATLGITLATDAYGPIADNAGGNAEMTGQDPEVRERTDALDSLGNTTAAMGKGFAIGSAALTALALLAAYVEEVRIGLVREADTAIVQMYDKNNDKKVTSDELKSQKMHVLADGELKLPCYVYNSVEKKYKPRMALVLNQSGRKDLQKALRKGEELTILSIYKDEKAQFNFKKDSHEVLVKTKSGEKLPLTIAFAHEASLRQYMDYYGVNLMNPKVLGGLFAGVLLVFLFSALTMKAVGRAAMAMVKEVRRQFKEMPGILKGTTTPEYAKCVAISTAGAQREMIIPSLLALIVPIVVGLFLDVAGVLGLLAGGLASGFAMAIFMANAGGAWDNAKKYVETGKHGGKGSEAHKATVVGDTVGDPFKDTSGPSLNILIKLMSMVSVVFAGLIVEYAPVISRWLGMN